MGGAMMMRLGNMEKNLMKMKKEGSGISVKQDVIEFFLLHLYVNMKQ